MTKETERLQERIDTMNAKLKAKRSTKANQTQRNYAIEKLRGILYPNGRHGWSDSTELSLDELKVLYQSKRLVKLDRIDIGAPYSSQPSKGVLEVTHFYDLNVKTKADIKKEKAAGAKRRRKLDGLFGVMEDRIMLGDAEELLKVLAEATTFVKELGKGK